MPPAVAGIGLLAALGPRGLLGPVLDDLGVRLVLETAGVVVALTFVASPFYLRQAQAGFAAVDPRLLEASRTLGAGELRTFLRVGIPGARAALGAGAALAWGRALGEFGATLLFAGSLRSVTQTAPLAIYERFGTDFTGALALSAVLVLISALILVTVRVRDEGRRCCGLSCARRCATWSSTWRFTVEPGRCLALAGPSGAGKTSTLRALAGLLKPRRAQSPAARTPGSTQARAATCRPERRGCAHVVPGLRAVPEHERLA